MVAKYEMLIQGWVIVEVEIKCMTGRLLRKDYLGFGRAIKFITNFTLDFACKSKLLNPIVPPKGLTFEISFD